MSENSNIVKKNIEKIEAIFPNCVREVLDEEASSSSQKVYKKAIDFDMLKRMLGEDASKSQEIYEFTWIGKKACIEEALIPTTKKLVAYPKESLNFTKTQNLYIEGDNLDALKLLQEEYFGKIKMIYIDPPYNTGNDFIYRDSFAGDHSEWCCMMYPRLLLARDLLKEDGVIFISIDDNEVENLKKICVEIFRSENFIGMLSVENNPKGRKNSDFISVSSEYCLIFAKNKKKCRFVENIPKKVSDMKPDEHGRYVHNSGKRVLVGENKFNHPLKSPDSEKNYSVYYRQEDRAIVLKREVYGEKDEDLLREGYQKYYSHSNGELVENTYTRQKLMQLFEEDALSFSSGKIYEKNFKDRVRIKSQLVNKEYEAIVSGEKKKYSMELTTTGAGTYLKSLFKVSHLPFPAPKNTGFLKILLSLFEEDDFYAMDFFAGSSSFADALMQLNAQDKGKRKFIMVQIPEILKENSHAYQMGYRTICDIGKERIRLAGDKIKKDNLQNTEMEDLDTGFRVLKIE